MNEVSRHCTLTGELCTNTLCTEGCYGLELAQVLAQNRVALNTQIHPQSTVNMLVSFSSDQIKAINRFINPPEIKGNRQGPFEDFLTKLP